MWKFLVRSMQIIVRQSEAHHDAGNLQYVLKIRDDRNRAPRPDKYRVLLESVVPGLGSTSMYSLSVLTTHAGPLLQTFTFVSIPFGVFFLMNANMFLEDFVGILVGHEAHRNFGFRLRRNDSLRAIGSKASRHAVNFSVVTPACNRALRIQARRTVRTFD